MPNVSRRRLLVTVGAAVFTVVLRPFPALADLLDKLFGHSESKATKPITPNDEFYVTSNRNPPTIQVDAWSLSVTGLVERPIVLTIRSWWGDRLFHRSSRWNVSAIPSR